jgi:hypothetical protein
MPIPSRKAESWDIKQRIRGRCEAATGPSIVGREAEPIHPEQCGEAWLEALELTPVIGG